jgi:transcriptional regulator with XRE-family HTH domain
MPNRLKLDRPKGNNQAVVDFIHEQMQLRGWKYYAEFARAVGTDGAVVARWLRDRTPSPAMTRQMAQRLGVDQDWLLALVGHREPQPGDETPEQAALIAKIRQISFDRDRYLTLDALLEDWRKREPPSQPSTLK